MANYKTSWVQRLIEGAWQKTFAFAHAKTVYTDFANKKTLADKLSEIDTEIGNKAESSEIPTKVSQLNNDSNYQTETQVKSTVSDEVAKIVADAPESFDTLKEISDWISGHENDASAMNSAIKNNQSAITTLQSDKANKTEIPTELPAKGGDSATVNGHTVKSDVPENAVFTDTVYDYSALLGYDIYNLVSLKDATYQANKTWLSKDFIAPFDGFVFFMVQTDATSGAFTQIFKEDDVLVSNNQKNIADFNTWGEAYRHQIYKGKTYHFGSYNNTATAFNKVMLCIRKKLETPTEYVPYAPSNVALAEENTQQSTEMMDIKMLGWSVPKECPVQNEVSGNQFMQKVGRVDLSSLSYTYEPENMQFYSGILSSLPQEDKWNYNLYCNKYPTGSISGDSFIASYGGRIYIRDKNYTNGSTLVAGLKNTYLYYELATPITTTIDGNEIGETVSDVRKETTVNLLNPTLLESSVSNNGITCTNNEDGTYTFSGTATDTAIFTILNGATTSAVLNRLSGEKLKLIGCPKGGSYLTYKLQVYTSNHGQFVDLSNGAIFTVPSDAAGANVAVVFYSGYTANNLIFKPMLTTNLNATYDDFVPYTGDRGSLNGDVADLRGDVDGMLMSAEVRKVYYNLAGNSFDSETAGKTMIAKVNFANFKNKSMIASGDFIINSLPFNTAKKGDYLEVRLSKSDYPDLASKIDSGIKKLAFGISGDFSGKAVGHVNCVLQDDYIRIWLTFNDAYNFNTSTLQSGIADFFF